MIRTRAKKVQATDSPPRELYKRLFATPVLEERRREAFGRAYELAYEYGAYLSDIMAGLVAGLRDRRNRKRAQHGRVAA